jgi:hypothetical protein
MPRLRFNLGRVLIQRTKKAMPELSEAIRLEPAMVRRTSSCAALRESAIFLAP